MEIYTQMLAVLDIMMTLFTGVLGDASGSFMGAQGSFFDFAVQEGTVCTPTTCPGSFYTAITTAWANIGYLTHADVLRFINTSHFGKWAILLYIAAAITGLLGVATNSPMRNYTWFFIGPALYSFLVGTTMPVQGVNWVVANRPATEEGMAEVWRNAEAGLANTRLALDGLMKIKGKNGPDREYEVAMPMVFLDELFSATSNILIEWTGIGRQVDNGGAESNLSAGTTVAGRQASEAWWLMSNMKWGYIENITGSTIRNPDLRDALITFLASECGDLFKQGIDSNAYIAATQARGATVVDTVIKDNSKYDYIEFNKLLGNVHIPTPRSMGRLFKEKNNGGGNSSKDPRGSFVNFSQRLNKAVETGRTHSVVCSEYLWTIIQGLRFEAGSAYYQMLRSAPAGFKEEAFVKTLTYGWDARENENKDLDLKDQKAFLKHLIMAYILRNELISAPQLTTIDQRYAPAEQAKSYSEANIRSFGAKAKFIELYNAAVMMPYLQGILAYFLIVSYPIACMLVILPGHYKGFFTWVSFFAWIKLWDVGFAMVHVVERSVWSMIGNHEHMAATSRTLISTAKKVGGIGADGIFGMGIVGPVRNPEVFNAVPVVCSLAADTVDGKCNGNPGADQSFIHAFELFDKLLLTSANLDLDLSNGWYIYIMAALYTAVPAVTGQLVLGAKAGSASLVKDAFQGAANDGGQAAKTGAQHQAVNALQTNQKSLGQMARTKALRKGDSDDAQGRSLALQSFDAGKDASMLGVDNASLGGRKEFLSTASGNAYRQLEGYGRATNFAKQGIGAVDNIGSNIPGVSGNSSGGGGGGNQRNNFGKLKDGFGSAGSTMMEAGRVNLGHRADGMNLEATAQGQDIAWAMKANDLSQGALKDAGSKLSSAADFEADSSAWEAKNEFAAHASAMGGIAGMNAGSLSPNEKPSDTTQLAVSGNLGSKAADSAWYSKEQLPGQIAAMQSNGTAAWGMQAVRGSWKEGGGNYGGWDAVDYAKKNALNGGIYNNSDASSVHTSVPDEKKMADRFGLDTRPPPETK